MRRLLSFLVDTCLSFGTAAVVAGLLAPWWPALEMANHFRPFLVIGAGLLLTISLMLRSVRLILSSAILTATTLALLIAPALLYGAPGSSDPEPDLRVATLNTWSGKEQVSRISSFIEQTKADIVLLQEVGRADREAVLEELARTYPHILLDRESRSRPALLSRLPWIDSGIISNGRGRPLAVWARFVKDGQEFVIASVHTANPFEWKHQPGDINRLIEFVRSRRAPVILGGDFNLTPFSWKLSKLAQEAGLKWGQTFAASWPANSLIPIVLLDHILVSEGMSISDIATGPPVGSDHLPVVADVSFTSGSAHSLQN